MPGKLGFGLYNNDDAGLADDLANSGATTCFLMDNALVWASRIKRANPSIIIVGRNYYDIDAMDAIFAAGDAFAQQYLYDWGYRLAGEYPDVDTWALFCEYGDCSNQIGRLEKQVKGERWFTDGVAARGKTTTILNISTGNYAIPSDPNASYAYSLIGPLCSYPGVKYCGLHAYGSGAQEIMEAPDADFHALRYRLFRQGLAAAGYQCPPIIFTEYGQVAGWTGIANFGEDGATRDYLWFGEQIQPDPSVVGGTNFLHGWNHDPNFLPFDTKYTSIYTRVVDWNKQFGGPVSGSLPLGLIFLAAVSVGTAAYVVGQYLADEQE